MTSTIEPATGSGAGTSACAGGCEPPRRAATAMPRGALRRPAEMTRNIDVSGLVDAEGGLLDRAIFTEEQIYRQELRRVFAPSWLFLAPVSYTHLTLPTILRV